jgi:polygalacturonase
MNVQTSKRPMMVNSPIFHRVEKKCVVLGCVALAWIFFGTRAAAVTPWTLLVNTNNIIVVTNAAYGAVGNGVATNTGAIQSAINQAAKGGTTNGLSGGTVEIPAPGIYLCGPLNMSNCINLQIDAGAILRMLPLTNYPGTDISPPNFISGSSLHDLAITGSGTVDGQGLPWWIDSQTNAIAIRPLMVNFGACTRVLIQDVTCSNTPCQFFVIKGTAGNVTLQSVQIYAPDSGAPVNPSHNTDGLDLAETNALITGCTISTGDDNIAIGSSDSVSAYILVTNCTFGAGHGCSIGSYTAGGVSNLTVINCSFTGTQSGFKVKSMRGRGGLVQNCNYFNLTMTNVDWPVSFDSHYEFGLGQHTTLTPAFVANNAFTNPAPLTSTTPIIQNITVSNVTAVLSSTRPPFQIWGLPEALVSNIVFRSVNISSSAPYIPAVYNATNIQFQNCSFNLSASAPDMQFWNANLIFTNSPNGSAATNLWTFDGLTTNLLIYNGTTSNLVGNSFQLYNALGSLNNTNALDDGPLTLAASTFTVSNNFSLAPGTILNFVVGTNPVTLAVIGNLMLGGTNNIFAGPGFTNGTYTLMTYSGLLNGDLPVFGTVPGGYGCVFDTNTAGVVKLIVATAPASPTNLFATAANAVVALNWSASSAATNYNVKRSLTSGSGYATITSLAGTNYSDMQVTNGRTYFYVVSASNANGESTNSAEVSATPKAIVFNDLFAGSSLNSVLPSAPTATSASYQLISSKTWSPTPTIAAGHLKFGIAATGSGLIEAQALFASSPVTLAAVGDTLSLVVTFTNTTGLFAQTNYMGFGLYNSGQNAPVPVGLNGTATSGSVNTNNATGNAQTWVGYVGQLNFTNASSQILTRAAQNGTANNNQELLTTGSSASYSNPGGITVGTAASTASVVLSANSLYTDVLTITLTATNTLAITNSLYSGTNAGGALLSQFGAVASGSAYLTNSFDALAIGWRAAIATAPTAIDINNISVSTGITASPVLPPPAPASLQANATNLLINLNWNSVASATNYNLKRGTTNNGSYPTIFSGLTATNYSDANVTNAVNYYYVVSAVGAGGESTNSLQANAVPLPSNQPTNIVLSVSSGQMQLSWPQDHLGWRLQIQTNSLTNGLGTNWVTVPNSTNVIATNIVINPTNGSVFLRMIYP